MELYVAPAFSGSGITYDLQGQLQDSKSVIIVSFEVFPKHRCLVLLSNLTSSTFMEKLEGDPAWHHRNVTEELVTLTDVMLVGATRSDKKDKTVRNV